MLNSVLKLRSHAQRNVRAHGGYTSFEYVETTEYAALSICSTACKRGSSFKVMTLFYSNTEVTKWNSLLDEGNTRVTIYKQYQHTTLKR